MIHHKHTNKLIIFLVVLGILFCVGGMMTGWVAQENQELKDHRKIESVVVDKIIDEGQAEVIILLKENAELKDIEVSRKYSSINAVSGVVDKNELEELKKNPDVEKIYFNHIYHVNIDESVPLVDGDYVQESKLNNMYLKGKYETACIVDTGVNYNHAALSGRVISGPDYYNNDSDSIDDEGHGTHVAGIVASNDSTYTGIAPEASIIAVKVCDETGEVCGADDVFSGIDWCINHSSEYNISVIGVSLGSSMTYNSSTCPTTFNSLANTAVANGIMIVASSGNSYANDGISHPACESNITAVGASDKSNVVWDRSNSGNDLDLLAPGVSITSSDLVGFDFRSGTSMAAPHVIGAVLLMNQHTRLNGGSIDVTETLQKLKDTGVNLTDSGSSITTPRIDIDDAVLDSKLEIGISSYPKTNYNVTFYANYTNRTDGSPISGGGCIIDINGTHSSMTYNSGIYEYNHTFSIESTYPYNITCNDSNFETLINTDSAEIIEGSQDCDYYGSNEDWNLTGNNFSRCVGENILLNESNIKVSDNADFYLEDSNITLIEASEDYFINITGNGNITLKNVYIKGESSSNNLDLYIESFGYLEDVTFEDSKLIIFGNQQSEIKDSTFNEDVFLRGSSETTITDSLVEGDITLEETSKGIMNNSNFTGIIYLEDNSILEAKNMSSSNWIMLLDSSSLNSSSFSNLSDALIWFGGNNTISGEIDMPTTWTYDPAANITRYFPVYVYRTGTNTPYANRIVKVVFDGTDIIALDTTDSNGYAEVSAEFNDTNHNGVYFNVSTNETEYLTLHLDTPITLEAIYIDDGGDGGGSGGGSSSGDDEECIENWECTQWGVCTESGLQARTCLDFNNCGTNLTKPNTIQSCVFIDDDSNTRSSTLYQVHSDDLNQENLNPITIVEDNCCLLGICWFKYIICWYWWILIIIVIITDIIVLWKINKKRKRKKLQKALTHALGIDWTLKQLHLD